MSRLPLVEPEALPPYLKAIHDATPEENWLGRHFARAFAPAPDLVQAYQAFYHPWHTGDAGLLPARPRARQAEVDTGSAARAGSHS